jgi:hypothetical protein
MLRFDILGVLFQRQSSRLEGRGAVKIAAQLHLVWRLRMRRYFLSLYAHVSLKVMHRDKSFRGVAQCSPEKYGFGFPGNLMSYPMEKNAYRPPKQISVLLNSLVLLLL